MGETRRSFFGLLFGIPAAAPFVVTPAAPERAISYEQPACPACRRMIWIRAEHTEELLTPQKVTCDCGWTGEAVVARRI